MEYGVAVAILCIVCGGFAGQWIAWKAGMPAIVLLLAIGLLVGPGLQVLQPGQAFGPALRPVIGLAVAIVVFEGGLALDMRELRAAGEGVVRLTALALPINFGLGSAAARFVGGLNWPAAILFGAIMVVTGPTVILPLLRQARLERRVASFLKWEAIVNDPIGAILATIVLEALVLGSYASHGQIALELALHVAAGVVLALALGIGAALLTRWAFHRDEVPEILKTPMLITLVLGVYALSNLAMHEAGLIAATVFGVALANLHVSGLSELRRFKEALVVLLVSALFITLAADLDRSVLMQISWPILALTAAMLFVVRPASIFLATLGDSLKPAERLLVGWIAPRGIVAAAVAGIAGLRLGEAGYPGAELVQPTVFAVIAASVLAHGFSLGPLARRLGLVATEAPRLAIVGASPWTIDLAATLDRLGVPVLLADTFPGALEPARRLGLATIQAELLSQHGEEEVAEQPIDYVLAATPDEVYNALVCTRLAPELGRERVYQIAPAARHMVHPERGLSRDWRGKVLADRALDYDAYEERHAAGWRFAASEGDGRTGIALMVIRSNGRLDLTSPDNACEPEAEPGDRVLAFAPQPAARPAAETGAIAAA